MLDSQDSQEHDLLCEMFYDSCQPNKIKVTESQCKYIYLQEGATVQLV